MVSVGAVRLIESPISSSRRAEEKSLRHSALWYPHVPPSTVDLNEASFQEPGTHVSGFKPLFWTRFGGPGGMYLRNLVKLTIVDFHTGRINFTFDSPDVPTECRSFPPCKDFKRNPKHTGIAELTIDGPGGEFIDKIEIGLRFLQRSPSFLCRKGHLSWLKVPNTILALLPVLGIRPVLILKQIHTNHGREVKVSIRPDPKYVVVEREFKASPGTAITGFYASRVSNGLFTALTNYFSSPGSLKLLSRP